VIHQHGEESAMHGQAKVQQLVDYDEILKALTLVDEVHG
jgi:7-keto-8-aminopelargonate synthetase-like enzyme